MLDINADKGYLSQFHYLCEFRKHRKVDTEMAKIDLTKYGITGTTEIVHNPSYEELFKEETRPELEGYEVGQETELGAVNVMTGVYTGRST